MFEVINKLFLEKIKEIDIDLLTKEILAMMEKDSSLIEDFNTEISKNYRMGVTVAYVAHGPLMTVPLG